MVAQHVVIRHRIRRCRSESIALNDIMNQCIFEKIVKGRVTSYSENACTSDDSQLDDAITSEFAFSKSLLALFTCRLDGTAERIVRMSSRYNY